MVLLILQQATDECSNCCNPWHLLLARFLLPRLRRKPHYVRLISMPHSNVSGAIISVITTRHVKSFMKPFVVNIYISVKPIAFSALDRAMNYHWQSDMVE